MNEIDWIDRAKQTSFGVYNIIDGRKSYGEGKCSIAKRSARNGIQLYEFGEGVSHDVDAAVSAAKAAFDDGRWAKKSIHERVSVIRKLAELVAKNADGLALYEAIDVGKPISNAIQDDIPSVSARLLAAAEAIDKLSAPSALDGSMFSYCLRKPVGVVGAIVGWNYPLSLAASKIGPALATGNSIVLKPSEFSALSGCRFAELALEAGVPPGVFNVVNGAGGIVGDALAHHPDIRLVSFTGSSATGKKLMKAAGNSNMKRLILECGGKSPFLVFEDYEGDLDVLARDIILDTAFRNQGALCVSSSRILLQSNIYDQMVPRLLDAAAEINPADPLIPETSFGAIINEGHLEKILDYVESGKGDGAELLYGGKQILQETGGNYVLPAIFDNVDANSRIAKEETFGPIASIFCFNTEDDAIQLANDSEYGLAAYAATSNAGRVQRLGRELEAGIVTLINTLDISPGGIFFGSEPHKQSGFGVEGGLAGLAAYTNTSHVSVLF